MKVKMMSTTILIISILVFSIVLSGCITTLYEVDLANQRRVNLEFDLEMLRPETPVVMPDPLTLNEAVSIGLENNLDIRISRVMADIATDDALVEKLKMLPQANFSSRVSQSSATSASDEDTLRRTASLALTWNVLDFGLSYIRARQSAISKEIRRMERLRQAQILTLDIASAYWKAVLAEQSLKKIRKIEHEINKYKTKAELMVSQRRLDPIASKAIEKKIVELAVTASNLQAEISGAKIDLCELMGVDPMTEFTPARESFKNYVKKMPAPDSLDPRKLEMISLNNRPEFYSADLDIQIQQDEARAALLSMFPGISFDLTTYYDANSYYKNNFWITNGAGLTARLLSWPSQYVNWVNQIRTTDMVRLQRLLLTSGVIVQAHLALHEYAVRLRQFELYDDSFEIAEDLLTMSRERHELGLLSSWALTQRMLEEVVARLARDRRIIDLVNAYNTLLVTLGLDYSNWGEPLPDMDEESVPEDINYKDT
ncbi:MAG TPA: TolC family protein [Desulfobacterales bacterium]|nr:TolC family protein [Desulfobacterales bacterium]